MLLTDCSVVCRDAVAVVRVGAILDLIDQVAVLLPLPSALFTPMAGGSSISQEFFQGPEGIGFLVFPQFKNLDASLSALSLCFGLGYVKELSRKLHLPLLSYFYFLQLLRVPGGAHSRPTMALQCVRLPRCAPPF